MFPQLSFFWLWLDFRLRRIKLVTESHSLILCYVSLTFIQKYCGEDKNMSKGVFLFLHNGLKMVLKCSEKEKDPGKFLLFRQKSFFLELNTSSALLPKPGWRLWDLRHPGCFAAASQAHLEIKIQPWNLWAPRLEFNLCHQQSGGWIGWWASPQTPELPLLPWPQFPELRSVPAFQSQILLLLSASPELKWFEMIS